jgi:diketogulonate reductase-like aldo/keto reductase
VRAADPGPRRAGRGQARHAGLTAPVDPIARPSHERPFLVLGAGRFAEACRGAVADPWLAGLPLVGSVDQVVDSTPPFCPTSAPPGGPARSTVFRVSIPTLTGNDGLAIPAVGFGTFPHAGDDSRTTAISALDAGYRLLDTALRYENERGVGRAVRECGLPRSEILVTTKLAGRHHGYDETIKGCHESLTNLGLDYVDIYLIHWPLPRLDKYVDSWKAMIKLRDEGLVRSIGVSNFTEAHLRRIVDETGVVPVMNQVEMHPHFPQAPLRAVHAELGIVTESWSPMGRGELLSEPTVIAIAQAHGVTPAQAVLRWHVQLGVVPIPKSADPARQRANIDLFGFALSDNEMAALSGMERGRIWGQDPEVYEEF